VGKKIGEARKEKSPKGATLLEKKKNINRSGNKTFICPARRLEGQVVHCVAQEDLRNKERILA